VKSLSDRLAEFVRACFTGLWIESHEHEDAIREIARLCRAENWRWATWDIAAGLQVDGKTVGENTADPLAAIRALSGLAPVGDQGASLLVLTNFQRFLGSPEIVQNLVQQIVLGKQQRTFIVILAPLVTIPIELEKLVIVVPHELPSRDQLAEIARSIATEADELPEGNEWERLLDAARGLTRYEAEGAFSLSLIRHERLCPEVLWEQKSQMLKKSGLLSLHRGREAFAELGGLDALKAFCLRALRPRPKLDLLCQPRGILLLGVSGSGKSAFCKALGNETGRPTLTVDLGSLMGSLVGQTEERTRQALQIADAMAPCVLMIDEVEKGLAGVNSGGQSDSGVSSRMFGTLLTWLNDHESDVFVVCTANDISKLPPEFTRAERFDGIFFLDLPNREQKDAIWWMYIEHYGLDAQQRRPDDEDWTGAEIKSCCRLAALLDLPLLQAAQNIVPVAATAVERIEQLRTWASTRCLSAERAGLYRSPNASKPSSIRRRVQRNPSNN
jgi:hypothetical protein